MSLLSAPFTSSLRSNPGYNIEVIPFSCDFFPKGENERSITFTLEVYFYVELETTEALCGTIEKCDHCLFMGLSSQYVYKFQHTIPHKVYILFLTQIVQNSICVCMYIYKIHSYNMGET